MGNTNRAASDDRDGEGRRRRQCAPRSCIVRMSAASRCGRPQLLPVTRHDEEAVVDRQPESHRRRQVQREHRHIGKTIASSRSTTSVPTTARPATGRGSRAAPTLPNTISSSRSVIGRAMDSARLEMQLNTGAHGVIDECRSASDDRQRARRRHRLGDVDGSVGDGIVVAGDAHEPRALYAEFVLFNGGGRPSDQYRARLQDVRHGAGCEWSALDRRQRQRACRRCRHRHWRGERGRAHPGRTCVRGWPGPGSTRRRGLRNPPPIRCLATPPP